MTDVQKVLIRLLGEIDQAAKQNDITYYLAGKTAKAAVSCHGFSDDTQDLDIMVSASDIRKLIKILSESAGDRYVESMLSNRSFGRVGAYYGDSSTLDLSTTEWGNYKNHGIHVTIDVLRPCRNAKIDRMRCLAEYAWEMSIMTQFRFHRITAPAVFDFAVSKDRHGQKEVYVRELGKKSRTIMPAEWFGSADYIDFEGMEAPVPCCVDQYLEKLYGVQEDSVLQTMGKYDTDDRLVDAEISFDEYLTELSDEGVDIDEIWAARVRFVRKYKYAALLNLKIRKAWGYLFLSGDRYALYDIYEPKKEHLKELYSEDRFDELEKEFALYREICDKHLHNRLGVCFDREIFHIFYDTLVYTGNRAYADRVKAGVPEKHWEDIRLVDYKGNPV